ncbi:hypothetical protein DYE48_05230 [Halobacillus trueperi]|uniref:Uncharacterized protein n=1 Tax=Halobacillus trueperi TaxID=156205 RepID=A0A3E0JBF0_9BACI|nr:hypothetical protein DYE48_05230 [Halobacillus trueperi]
MFFYERIPNTANRRFPDPVSMARNPSFIASTRQGFLQGYLGDPPGTLAESGPSPDVPIHLTNISKLSLPQSGALALVKI